MNIDGEKIADFDVGIRFQEVGQEKSNEDSIRKKHWALVFTSTSEKTWSFQIELCKEDKGKLVFPVQLFDKRIDSFPLGTWTGSFNDIVTHLMEIHPMRFSSYNLKWNNCQHWAATMLVFMKGLATEKTNRWFIITNYDRYNRVLSVLDEKENNELCHKYNPYLKTGNVAVLGGSAAAAGISIIAATATTTVAGTTLAIVPATGLAGFLGMSTLGTVATSVTVNAVGVTAAATVGAIALPIALVGTTFLALDFFCDRSRWRSWSAYKDPRVSGVPKKWADFSKLY
ncbi:hypothetical protein H072_4980 [Dactylellina haptotyla CBS 200.50]|uniref:PPPDE domain-containing protein n=1 Tax=Dactylellina haptotyla (strain CBS 200.50) TaxID=1284197 RepID=S8AJ33_DACHA|nr:hypothetical protein H072_4980 [Dactylellina haptotyla CBS 200.50]